VEKHKAGPASLVAGGDQVRIPPRPLLLLRSTHTPAFRDSLCVLGTTRRTDTEIEEFGKKFKNINPKYLGLSVNCQCYARELLVFLMADGTRKRDLPPPESAGSLLPRANLFVYRVSTAVAVSCPSNLPRSSCLTVVTRHADHSPPPRRAWLWPWLSISSLFRSRHLKPFK
jgi:hypothetical protein